MEKHFYELPERTQQHILRWIRRNIKPRKTPLLSWTSFGLTHLMAYDIGVYCDNEAFKEAMTLCGFEPVDPTENNWSYCISKTSPAFHHGCKRRPI